MAGTSMKDIKLRIRSVESTRQITKAMQLVATSKLRRAKERMENSKPYAAIAHEAVTAAARSCTEQDTPFVAAHPDGRRCYVIIAGERGLAGGYNSNVFKAVAAHCGGVPAFVLPIGRKAVEKYQREGAQLLSNRYSRVEGLGVGACYRLANELIEGFLSGQYSEIFLACTSFHSMMAQEAMIEQLLPVERPGQDGAPACTIYEPGAAETLRRIMPDFIAGRIYSALCDSFASEVAARRTAMDAATKNADAMISDLTLKYNRARQGAITQEITEIVAGAEE